MKKGYTLAEVLITLCVIGILVAIMLPMIHRARPDAEKSMYLKNYDAIVETVHSLAKQKKLYPAVDEENHLDFSEYPFVYIEGKTWKGISISSGANKLANAICEVLNGKNKTEGQDADGNDTLSFKTPQGVEYTITTKFTSPAKEDPASARLSGIYKTKIDFKTPSGNTYTVIAYADNSVFPLDGNGIHYIQTRVNLLKASVPVVDSNDRHPGQYIIRCIKGFALDENGECQPVTQGCTQEQIQACENKGGTLLDDCTTCSCPSGQEMKNGKCTPSDNDNQECANKAACNAQKGVLDASCNCSCAANQTLVGGVCTDQPQQCTDTTKIANCNAKGGDLHTDCTCPCYSGEIEENGVCTVPGCSETDRSACAALNRVFNSECECTTACLSGYHKNDAGSCVADCTSSSYECNNGNCKYCSGNWELDKSSCSCECNLSCSGNFELNKSKCKCECNKTDSDCGEGRHIVNSTCTCADDVAACTKSESACTDPWKLNEKDCDCECSLTSSDCSDHYKLNTDDCKCECNWTKANCTDESKPDFSEEDCDCYCNEPESCPGHWSFNSDKCDCSTCNHECTSPWELDPTKCECKCALNSNDCGENYTLDSTNCECKCGLSSSSCTLEAAPDFDEDNCQCVCNTVCELPWKLDPDTCSCECTKSQDDCDLGFTFHSDTCSCTCDKKCDPGTNLDLSTCLCKTIECDPCSKGSHHPSDLDCSCVCDYPSSEGKCVMCDSPLVPKYVNGGYECACSLTAADCTGSTPDFDSSACKCYKSGGGGGGASTQPQGNVDNLDDRDYDSTTGDPAAR